MSPSRPRLILPYVTRDCSSSLYVITHPPTWPGCSLAGLPLMPSSLAPLSPELILIPPFTLHPTPLDSICAPYNPVVYASPFQEHKIRILSYFCSSTSKVIYLFFVILGHILTVGNSALLIGESG